ncbi:unnamed protein product [Tuwongella immobilis]|uniref:AtpZ/AtpI family protein n=1 Tax=Tuwongella immobilis TaxID=692036 RepID=A0A6C2YRG4_9BACT|nr:unnamed protein product [Tuwongella immobilis]VTS04296.1 unnamed protein product [Tuwongella immobilis]
MTTPQSPPPRINRYDLMVVGSELSGPVILGLLVDLSLQTLPWVTLGGVFVGTLTSGAHLIRLILRSQHRSD